jgi:hypothetical protein
LRLKNVYDETINGAVNGIIIGGGIQLIGENRPHYIFVHHKSHMRWDETLAMNIGSWRLIA